MGLMRSARRAATLGVGLVLAACATPAATTGTAEPLGQPAAPGPSASGDVTKAVERLDDVRFEQTPCQPGQPGVDGRGALPQIEFGVVQPLGDPEVERQKDPQHYFRYGCDGQ